jgi:hypothetical protein
LVHLEHLGRLGLAHAVALAQVAVDHDAKPISLLPGIGRRRR